MLVSAPLVTSFPSTSASLEQRYKKVVKDHFQEFIKNTRFESISSYLHQADLLSSKDYDNLSSNTDKGNLFYISILPSKGAQAYTMLRHCIAMEKDHRGHIELNKLFEDAERSVGISLSFN